MVMISYHEALQMLLESATPIAGVDSIPIEEALGRFTSEDVLSVLPNPPFSNSAMDGFALRYADIARASTTEPVELSVSGVIGAGEAPGQNAAAGARTAIEITTGAPIPAGYDAVIRIEDVELKRDASGHSSKIKVSLPLKPGENIRFTGEDFASGELLVPAGTEIMPEHLMALTSTGISTIKVFRRPRVALLSTGKEIVGLNQGIAASSLPIGKIFNSTAPFIVSALERMGADIKYYGIVPDQKEEFFVGFRNLLKDDPDIIITTGAVSVGLYDFIPEALEELGAEVLFHRLAIRPGRPMLFARQQSASGKTIAIFGFPGNQISSVIGQRFFVAPYLRRIFGAGDEVSFKATLCGDFKKPIGLRTFCLGRLNLSDGVAKFAPWPRQMSFMLGPILHSNTWAILPEGQELFKAGQQVDCMWLYPVPYQYR
jgi:molybdopterin molybdotransferase